MTRSPTLTGVPDPTATKPVARWTWTAPDAVEMEPATGVCAKPRAVIAKGRRTITSAEASFSLAASRAFTIARIGHPGFDELAVLRANGSQTESDGYCKHRCSKQLVDVIFPYFLDSAAL